MMTSGSYPEVPNWVRYPASYSEACFDLSLNVLLGPGRHQEAMPRSRPQIPEKLALLGDCLHHPRILQNLCDLIPLFWTCSQVGARSEWNWRSTIQKQGQEICPQPLRKAEEHWHCVELQHVRTSTREKNCYLLESLKFSLPSRQTQGTTGSQTPTPEPEDVWPRALVLSVDLSPPIRSGGSPSLPLHCRPLF